MTPEQLQRYWDANPQALQQAVMSNPGMFGQDITRGTPTLQRTEQLSGQQNAAAPPSALDLTALNSSLKQNLSPEAMIANFEDWQGAGGMPVHGNVSGGFGIGLGDYGRFAGQARADYGDALDEMLTEAGRARVEQIDGQLYALNTGQDIRFKSANAVPVGYEFAENVPVGEWGRIRVPKDNFFDKYISPIVKNGVSIMAAATGNPWVAALGSGANTAAQGGDIQDVLKAAAIGGLTTGVGGAGNSGVNAAGVANPSGLFGGMTEGAIRSGLEAGTREAIRGGISGDFDIGNIAQSALTGGAVKGATDFVNDSIDTSAYTDANLEKWEKAGLITADEADELAALYQKSSVGALFGPNAFLNNTFGVGSELISTKPFDDVLNTISSGVDFLLDNPVGNAIANSPITKGLLNAAAKLMGVANPSPQEVKDFMNNNYDLNPNNPNYNYERARLDRDLALREFEYGPNYNLETLEQEGEVLKLGDEQFNEEFFVEDAERSEDSPVSGTHYSNPFGSTPPPQSNSTTPTTATGGEAPLPQQESEDKRIQQVLEEYWRNNPEALDEAIAANPDAFGVDPELISGQTPDGDLPNVAEDPLPSDANEEELLGMGGVDYTLPPSISDYNSTGSIEDDLPPSGGGGGALPESSSNGGLMGKGDFQEFMAGISYMLPVIQQMGIPMEDFMKMWMNNR
jgi:hypothetical protein